jgi:predicted nucleic acid-binding Zn finger protein
MPRTAQAPKFQTKVIGQSGEYTLKLHADGVASCSCPAWRFSRAPKGQKLCKHLIAFADAAHKG